MTPSLDGAYIFGPLCHVTQSPRPLDRQVDAYPGINGVTSLMMGSRGRSFLVRGILVSDSIFDLAAAKAFLESYADGIGRTFVDTDGTSWPNVLLEGPVQYDQRGPRPCPDGWLIEFACMLTGLS